MKSLHFIIVTTIITLSQLLSVSIAQTVAAQHKSGNVKTGPSYKTISVDSIADYSAKEKKIFDRVFNIPEVRLFAAYLEKHTKPIRHVQLLMEGTLDKTNKYYWVKVGEDNGAMFVTHYNFYVYTNPTRIYFLDTVDDKIISLQEWRRGNRK